MRYKLKIAYDGTAYAGWQVQPGQRTVQGEIERIFSEMVQSDQLRLEASGRTDAGVHAREQVAHVDVEHPLSHLPSFMRGLNAQLDGDIRIHSIQPVPDSFHARFNAKGKEYRYFIYTGKVLPPTKRLYFFHKTQPMDLSRMREAARFLEGKHDFTSFAGNRKYPYKDTVRTIHSLQIMKKGAELTLKVSGDGFLYKMVRSIAGFLMDVGIGRLDPAETPRIIESAQRTARVPTAPPQGLFLWKVFYDSPK